MSNFSLSSALSLKKKPTTKKQRFETWSHLFLVCFFFCFCWFKEMSARKCHRKQGRERERERERGGADRAQRSWQIVQWIMYLNIYFFKVAVTHWEQMASPHLNQRCLCQKQKKRALYTHNTWTFFSLADPSSRWICGYFLQRAPTGPSGDAPGIHRCPFTLPHCKKYPRHCPRHVYDVLFVS